MRTIRDSAARRWGLIAMLMILLWPVTATAQSEDPMILMQRISELTQAGRYAEAIPYGERMVAQVEKMAGKEHQLTAMTLFTLAELHRMQGQFAEAESMLNRVLAIRERTLGTSHPDVAATLSSLAQLCLSMARYGEAESNLERALDVQVRALGREHADTGMTLITIGRLRQQQGRLDEAETNYRDALAIFEKVLGPDHIYVSVAFNNLAELHKAQGRLADVEADLLRALQIREKRFGPDSHAIAPMLNNLGELRRLEGRYAEAEAFYRRELEITEKALGPDHPEFAKSLGNIGSLFVRQGRAADAESLLRRSLAIQEKALGPEHPDVAVGVNNLADALDELGRPAEAEPLLRRSLAVREKHFGQVHASVAVALDNLGVHLHKQKRFAEAVPLARRSLAIREQALGVEHPSVAYSLNNLATMLDMLDRHDEATPLLQRALSLREKIYGADQPEVAISLHNLASNNLDLKQWESAYRLFKRAGEIWIARQARSSAAKPSDNRSEVSANTDPFYGLIVAAFEMRQAASRRSTAELEAEAFAAAQWVTASRAASAISAMSTRFAARSDRLGQLVRTRQDLAEQALAADRAVIAAVSQSAQDGDAAKKAALRQLAAEIGERLKDADTTLAGRFPEYAALTYPTPVSVPSVQEVLRPQEALLVFAPARDATYAWLVTKTRHAWILIPIASEALKERVATLRCGLDATAWYGESALRCASLMKIGLDAAPKQSDPLPFDAAIAGELYGLLFGQVAELIKDKHLLIVPSGPLTNLPFSVLVTEQPAVASPGAGDYRNLSWLGTRQPITMLPSVAALKALRQLAKQSAAKNPYLGVGNPLLEGQPDDPQHGAYFKKRALEALDKQTCSKSSSARITSAILRPLGRFSTLFRGVQADIEHVRELAPLPETADELCEIARRLGVPESEILLGGRATETALKSLSESGRLADYAILHFATHGALAGQVQGAAEPGLILTPPPKETRDPKLLARNDGYLTASEIATLKLNADWVILSACNTAGGTGDNSEALSGMARAFFFAGARALLVSHWEVDSQATVNLTTRAFAALKANPRMDRAEAFRLSMRNLIEEGAPANAHPSLWAPFVVVGEGAR